MRWRVELLLEKDQGAMAASRTVSASSLTGPKGLDLEQPLAMELGPRQLGQPQGLTESAL